MPNRILLKHQTMALNSFELSQWGIPRKTAIIKAAFVAGEGKDEMKLDSKSF